MTGEEVELFEAEYVNIFGVPFTFLPHEGENGPLPPPPPKIRIEAVRDKIGFLINRPNLIRIDHVYRPKLELNGARPLVLQATDKIENAEMAAVVAGTFHKFRPDLLIRLTTGTNLIVEMKGENTPKDETKRRYLEEWVRSVNEHGGFGEWQAHVCLHPSELPTKIQIPISGPDRDSSGQCEVWANAPSPCRGQ